MLRSETKSTPAKSTLVSVQPFHDGYIAGVYYDQDAKEFQIKVSELHSKKNIFEFEPIKEEKEFGNMRLLLLSDRRVLAYQMNNKARIFHLDGTTYKCKATSLQKFHKIELVDRNTLIAEHSFDFKSYFSILDDKSLEAVKSRQVPGYSYWVALPSGEFISFESKVARVLEAYAHIYKNAMDDKPSKSLSLQCQYAIDPVALSNKIIAYKSENKYVFRNLETGKVCEILNTSFYDLVYAPLPDKKTVLVSHPHFYILDHQAHILSQVLLNNTIQDSCKSIAVSARSGMMVASFYGRDEIVVFPFAQPGKESTLFGRRPLDKPESPSSRANVRDPVRR